jgi:hypothetical protein
MTLRSDKNNNSLYYKESMLRRSPRLRGKKSATQTNKSKRKKPRKTSRARQSKDSGLSYSNNVITKTEVAGGKYYEVQKNQSNQFRSAKIQEILGSDVLFVRGSDKGGSPFTIDIGQVTDEEKKKLRGMAKSLEGWSDTQLNAISP